MTRRRLIVLVAAAALAAALSTPVLLYFTGRLPVNEPDAARYPVRGIDVSRHQGQIDWEAVASEGWKFAFIKASEGGDHRDRRFDENWRGARHAKLTAGAYHFFTFCKDGVTQADNFLETIAEAHGQMLAPGVDLEFKGNCSRRPTPEELRAELLDFIDRIERRLGVPPVFYVTSDFMRSYDDAMPPGADFWVRSVLLHPDRSFGPGWKFWQFSNRGRVAGIAGPVDLNAFNGSFEDWHAYLARRTAVPRELANPPRPL
jgi:lysozyme